MNKNPDSPTQSQTVKLLKSNFWSLINTCFIAILVLGYIHLFNVTNKLNQEVIRLQSDAINGKMERERLQTQFEELTPEEHPKVSRYRRDIHCSCPEGPPGKPGLPGEPGKKGKKGDTGPTGLVGVPGRDGFPGPIGVDGSKGEPGNPGSKGDKGDTGTAGAPGERGDTGAPGYDGMPGLKGDRGPPGLPVGLGEEWIEKLEVLKGEPGEKGLIGRVGSPGPPGPPGAPGLRGLPGFDAVPGPPGEIGPQGPPGMDGMPGSPGPKGEKGSSVLSHYSGYNRNIIHASEVAGFPVNFIEGPPGPPGLPGKKMNRRTTECQMQVGPLLPRKVIQEIRSSRTKRHICGARGPTGYNRRRNHSKLKDNEEMCHHGVQNGKNCEKLVNENRQNMVEEKRGKSGHRGETRDTSFEVDSKSKLHQTSQHLWSN